MPVPASHPQTTVDYLDLAADAPSHLLSDWLGFRLPAVTQPLTDVQKHENAVSEALVTQFLAADVIVASTRGGMCSTSEAGRTMEHQESCLQTVFGFFGITDFRFVRAEGLAMGDATQTQAFAAADRAIKALSKDATNGLSAAQAA